ncbi:MAG TPA: hypothetical protein VLD19_21545 [Chitinophagaceae bacterium]|nr:hypothetical protein [Chitinophagaceae bacterium]
MQYISPFHFITLPVTGAPDKKGVLLAKKKLLAELELNNDRAIIVNGKELGRNDVVFFFDSLLQSEQEIAHHMTIYRDKPLLQFLEHNTLAASASFAANPLYSDEAFIDWLSPYYANAFIELARKCYQHFRNDDWAALLARPILMNQYYRETTWTSLKKSIRADMGQLSYYSWKTLTRSDLKQIGDCCDSRRLDMLAQLPVARFSELRDNLALTIMEVAIQVFTQVDYQWALAIMNNSYQLAVTEDVKELLARQHAKMEKQAADNSRITLLKNRFWHIDRRRLRLSPLQRTKLIFGILGLLVLLGLLAAFVEYLQNPSPHK